MDGWKWVTRMYDFLFLCVLGFEWSWEDGLPCCYLQQYDHWVWKTWHQGLHLDHAQGIKGLKIPGRKDLLLAYIQWFENINHSEENILYHLFGHLKVIIHILFSRQRKIGKPAQSEIRNVQVSKCNNKVFMLRFIFILYIFYISVKQSMYCKLVQK